MRTLIDRLLGRTPGRAIPPQDSLTTGEAGRIADAKLDLRWAERNIKGFKAARQNVARIATERARSVELAGPGTPQQTLTNLNNS